MIILSESKERRLDVDPNTEIIDEEGVIYIISLFFLSTVTPKAQSIIFLPEY